MDNQTRINKRQGDSFVLFSSFQNQSAVWFIAKALGIWKSTRKETSFSPNGYVTAEDMIHCDPVLNGQVLGVFAADRLPEGTLNY